MKTIMILFCNSESNKRGRTAHVAHAYYQDVNGGIHVDLEPFEDSLSKEITCIVMLTMCNSEEKQLQHLKHSSRSHVDYCMWLLMNHPLYLLLWVVLLIIFISCPWLFFLFSVSCFTCFSSCRFYQTVSNKEGQGSSAWTLLGGPEWTQRVSHSRDIHLWCQLILKYFPGYYSLQKDVCDLVAQ